MNLDKLRVKLIKKLHEAEYLDSTEKLERTTPGHGSCCTCQTCGRHYDGCVCYSNGLLKAINKAFEEIKVLTKEAT